MLDLINTSEEAHYENYRLQQMETRKFGCVSNYSFKLSPLSEKRKLSASEFDVAVNRK